LSSSAEAEPETAEETREERKLPVHYFPYQSVISTNTLTPFRPALSK
jgi:hypothetical protein